MLRYMENYMDVDSKNHSKVLMVLPWELGPIGGVNCVVENLYNQFESHSRWKPLLLIQSWGDKRPVYVRENEHDKIRVRLRGPLEGKDTVLSLLKYIVSLPGELWKVRRILLKYDVEVVNAHYPTLGMVNVALARRLGLIHPKLILSLHGTDIRKAAEGNVFQKVLWRWLLRQADAVVAVSEGLARVAADFEPRIRSRLKVVHNGLDAARFVAGAQELGADIPALPGKRAVLSVGAFDHNKGQDVLLRAFANLADRLPDVHLLLVGQIGPELEVVRSLIGNLGLTQRVTMLTDLPRNKVAACMRLATLFVLPSRSEAFGLVVLEAGAFGLPVVASRVGGIPEIIAGPEYGLLVEPDDPEALERALEDLLQNAEKARELGENLRQRVWTVFSWEAAYQGYRAMLNRVGAYFAGECS